MDVIQNVLREMSLTTTDQFALYLEVEGELRCIKPDEFIFDALRLTMPEIQVPVGQKRSDVCKPIHFLICSLFNSKNQIIWATYI